MLGLSTTLTYLLFSWIAVTAVLFGMVIYGNALSSNESDQLYLNRAEQTMMAHHQEHLITRMDKLAKAIIAVGIFDAALLIATVGVWAWIGLQS